MSSCGYNDRATVNKVELQPNLLLRGRLHYTQNHLHCIGQALVHHEVEGLNVVMNQFLQCLDEYEIS